jgi:hypothetical protein
MVKIDIIIYILFFIILLVLTLTLYEINKFMPIIKTCDDDFAIINKCGCIPCSWANPNKYNPENCYNIKLNSTNISNG